MNKSKAKEKAEAFFIKEQLPKPTIKLRTKDGMHYTWNWNDLIIVKLEITDKNERKWFVKNDLVEQDYAIRLIRKINQ